MRKIIYSLIATPVIYLLIAFTLILLPIERSQPEHGLDFDVLKQQAYSTDSLTQQHYTARDNTSLFYRLIPGSADTHIVLLHGSGTEGRYLIPLANRLNAQSNATILIPDLRGHGHSQADLPNVSQRLRPGDISYLGQFEDDLEDLLVHIKSANPNTKVILVGHSSGGGLALKYGGNNLEQYDGTILLSPYLGYQAPTVRPNSGGWVQVTKRRYAGLAMLNNIGITGLNHYPVLFFNRPVGIKNELQLDSYSYQLNESLSPQDYAANLASNKKPIMLLVGENDEAFYPDAFKHVLAEYAPNAEFHVLQNTKHLDLPANIKTAELINTWLAQTYIRYN